MEVLSTLGENIFSFNTLAGLDIASKGNVNLSKITAQENGSYGVSVNNSTGAGKTVTINTLVTKMNSSYGLWITTSGKTTLNLVTSLNNGMGSDTDGLYVNSTSADGLVISNSFFLGNAGSGIEANLVSVNLLTLINTAYLGNDAFVSGDQNLNIY